MPGVDLIRRARAIGAVALAAAVLLPSVASAADPKLVDSRRIDARLTELTLSTPALVGPTRVRVLLPAGYRTGKRRYPVLYLLHGAAGSYRSWTDLGDAARLTAAQPLIVVMPDTGPMGGYVNWFNGGRFGPPRWESYHIDQLIPFIDRRYRTVARREGRALAGLSMGGFGTMSYAARHPDTFGAAVSFSGAVDTNNLPYLAVSDNDFVHGRRREQEVRWRGHNPVDLAENLRPVRLAARTGNGRPGGPFGGTSLDVIEFVCHQMNVALHQRLRQLRIPHVWDDYGPGSHTWPYWRRELGESLPFIMRAFQRPRRRESTFSHRAIEPSYRIWGWRVAIKRPALEFSELRRAGRKGFALRGSGTATVTTARLFRAGARVRAQLRSARGKSRRELVADRAGRLTVRLRLGRGNPRQQYTAGSKTAVFTTRVGFHPR